MQNYLIVLQSCWTGKLFFFCLFVSQETCQLTFERLSRIVAIVTSPAPLLSSCLEYAWPWACIAYAILKRRHLRNEWNSSTTVVVIFDQKLHGHLGIFPDNILHIFFFCYVPWSLVCSVILYHHSISQYEIVTCSVTYITGAHMWQNRCHRWPKRCHLWHQFCHMCTPVTWVAEHVTILHCNILEGLFYRRPSWCFSKCCLE